MKFTLALSSISGNAMKWKCRKSRGVTGFLPPPGGPMAPIKFTSSISLKLPISFLSYHPEKIVVIYLLHILSLFILGGRILHFSYTYIIVSTTHNLKKAIERKSFCFERKLGRLLYKIIIELYTSYIKQLM